VAAGFAGYMDREKSRSQASSDACVNACDLDSLSIHAARSAGAPVRVVADKVSSARLGSSAVSAICDSAISAPSIYPVTSQVLGQFASVSHLP